MKTKWEKSKEIFLFLDDKEIDYVIENVSGFRMWSKTSLDLVSRHSFDEWWHFPANGGGAACILSNERLRDLFIRCKYQLDKRKIRYMEK